MSYAAPECLVGDFSFSIVYFLGIVTYFGYSDAEPLRLDQFADFLTHTHSAGRCEARCCEERDTVSWLTGVGSVRQRDTAELNLGTHTNSQPGCGCVCFGLGFAVSRCLADGHWAHREGGGAGAPTSRLGQRVNTHTIQRCCMRNQCEFGKLHNVNLF